MLLMGPRRCVQCRLDRRGTRRTRDFLLCTSTPRTLAGGARSSGGIADRRLVLRDSAGKSSIRKVVFEGMAPSDTLFIERTNKSSLDDIKCVACAASPSCGGHEPACAQRC